MVTALFRPFAVLVSDLQEALGLEGMAEDPRFATLDDAKIHREALYEKLEPVFLTRTSEEWIPLLEAQDILVAPIRSTAEALEDPQLAVNNLIIEVEHPILGKMRHVGPPLRLKGTPARQHRAAPLLGEDSQQVLREMGWSQAEIDAMAERGLIG